MKFVTLVVMTMMLSFLASAQTTSNAAEKRTAHQTQQKPKAEKAKSSKKKVSAPKNSDVTTLTDERSYKAKWTFEQMLAKRLEIDAEDSERRQRQE